MAKCKLCKTNIPDGTEYCKDCRDKDKTKANESYLDSLLNSVKNSTPTTESIYKKKNKPKVEANFDKVNDPDKDDLDVYQVDLSDIEDFDQFNINDDLGESRSNIIIGDEELFGENLSEIFADEDDIEDEHYDLRKEISDIVNESENQKEVDKSISKEDIINTDQNNNIIENETTSSSEQSNLNIITNEISNYYEDDNTDLDLNDLLNSLDSSRNYDDDMEVNEDEDLNKNNDIKNEHHLLEENSTMPMHNETFEQFDADEDDFLSLLNHISSDDPVASDVKAINDLLNGEPVQKPKKSSTPSDVGEVFSDALKVVSSLNDLDSDEESLLDKIPDKNSKKGKKTKSKKDKTKNAKKSTEEKSGAEKGFFKRLFGNVEDPNSKTKTKSSKTNNEESIIPKEKTKKGSKKAAKGKKGKKGEVPLDDLDDSFNKDTPSKGKTGNTKDKKKDKAEKKKKAKEIIQVIDEIEEDEGRINRLGASIVFLFFGLLVLLLLAGTKVVSYSLSIQSANTYFDKRKYTQAYNEVYGIEIKDEDIEIYDKIMTVMFVNKQLNSYNNYYSLGQYPEALDSLLKGLRRYDKYIELATILGINTDLDYVREQILAELNNEFNLSEKQAIKILNYETMEEYSLKVYDVVLEQMNN